jgi:Kef-type K+ transport system membrane component KefB
VIVETGHSLIYLILIIATAKIGGEIAEYFKQPAVLGELLIGMLLGLTALRSASADPAIIFVGSIGIILLLFEVGLDSELGEFTNVGASAVLVAVIGVVIPLAAGFAAVYAYRGNYSQALFIGATLTATSIGITSRVLMDLGKMATREAKIILGAAVIDDILGLLLLSVVLQIAATGRADAIAVTKAVSIALAFLVAAIWIGIRFAPKLIPFAQKLKTRGVLVSIAFLFCLVLAFGAKELGLAEIIGAFAAGLVLATTDDRIKIQEQIKPVTDIFVPVFFVLVGLQVNLRDMNPLDPTHRSTLLMAFFLLILAVLGKVAAGVGVLSRGVSKLAVGVGMVPRGEVGLIFASIGLKAGIVTADLYGGLVLVVFITTMITPFWLTRVLEKKTETIL